MSKKVFKFDKNDLIASDLMIKGVSDTSKARQAAATDKEKACNLMEEGVSSMNRSIELKPENIENRKLRFRHLLGVSKESPKKYLKELDDDFNFFTRRIDNLVLEDKAFYYAVAGEYLTFIGERDKGIEYLKIAKKLCPGSLTSRFAELSLEKML